MSVQDEQGIISVATILVDRITRNAIEFMFRDKLSLSFKLSDQNKAEIVLIDMDAYQAKIQFNDFKNRGETAQLICLSIKEISSSSDIFLKKPINPPALINALEIAKTRIATVNAERKSLQQQSIKLAPESIETRTPQKQPPSLKVSTTKPNLQKHSVKAAGVTGEAPPESSQLVLKKQTVGRAISSVNSASNLSGNKNTENSETTSVALKNQVKQVNPSKVSLESSDTTVGKKILHGKKVPLQAPKPELQKKKPDRAVPNTPSQVTHSPVDSLGQKKQESLTLINTLDKQIDNNQKELEPEEQYFNPSDYLLGHAWEVLEFAKKNPSPVMARGMLEGIYIPRSQTVFIDIAYSKLRSLSLISDRTNEFTLSAVNIHNSDLRAKIDTMNSVPMEQLLWDLALWTSRGRIPDGTNPDAPIKLVAWPNLTQLTPTPYATQIIATWQNYSLSLNQTIKKFKIPQRYVFTLYTALYSIKLVSQQQKNSTAVTTQKKERKPNQLKHMFNGLLKKLGRLD